MRKHTIFTRRIYAVFFAAEMLLTASGLGDAQKIRLERPTCEYAVNPMGVDTAAVYLRKAFVAGRKIAKATAVMSGLGYGELYVNGAKTGMAVMDPAFTDYQRTVFYTAHDVTALMKRGEKVLGVILGNGFYNSPAQDLFQFENAHWKTPPKLLLNLIVDYTDGVICTDESWLWSTGEIVYNCVRGGETIDKRQRQAGWNRVGFDDARWAQAVAVPAPLGTLRGQIMPPMRVCETVTPAEIIEPEPGLWLVDFGRNMTGWIALEAEKWKCPETVRPGCSFRRTTALRQAKWKRC